MPKLAVGIKVVLDRLFASLVTSMISVMPAAIASFITCSIMGGSSTGSNSFGTALVDGNTRVTRPASEITAFFIFVTVAYPSAIAQELVSTINSTIMRIFLL